MVKTFVFVTFALLLSSSSSAGILCHRDAKVVAVDPIFKNKNDRCDGDVKIQGISYKCGSKEEAAYLTREFLSDLRVKGKEACEQFCKKRGRNCVAHFKEPAQCGFSVPPDQSEEVGAAAPCGDNCEGKHFIYCSIYHGSYLRYEKKFLKDKPPNCTCSRKS